MLQCALQCVAVCGIVLQCVVDEIWPRGDMWLRGRAGAAECCNVLQCLAVCCSACFCVLQCVAVSGIVLQCGVDEMWPRGDMWLRGRAGVAVHCSVLQCLAVCFHALKLQCGVDQTWPRGDMWLCGRVGVAECCSVLQCVAACCRVLQCGVDQT